MLAVKFCVCLRVQERARERDIERQGERRARFRIFLLRPQSEGISIAGGPAQPPSGGLDGQITLAIYKPQTLFRQTF